MMLRRNGKAQKVETRRDRMDAQADEWSREDRLRAFVAETQRAARASIIARGQGDPAALALWLRVAQGCPICSGDGITWPGGELCDRCGTPERAARAAAMEDC
jgi:hypothetical protein